MKLRANKYWHVEIDLAACIAILRSAGFIVDKGFD